MLEVIGYILLGLLALLLVLPAFPVFVHCSFLEELMVSVYVAGIPVFRFSSAAPKTETKKRSEEKAPTEQKDKPTTSSNLNPLPALARQFKEDGVGALLESVSQLARIAGGAFKRVLRTITVDLLRLRVFVATGDAADTAQTTGKICAALYPALSALQYALRIRKREVTVTPDYLAQKGKVEAQITAHVVPYRLLFAAVRSFLIYRKWNKKLQIQTTQNAQEGLSYGK